MDIATRNMNIAIIGLGQMGTLYMGKLLGMGVSPICLLGVDVDLCKVDAAAEKFPGVVFLNNTNQHVDGGFYTVGDEELETCVIDAAIVATNTPSHHRVIIDLMECGIKQIFCEKPLGLDMMAVDEIRDAMMKHGTQIYTAMLMNFSPVLLHLIDKMRAENLVLTEGTVVWGKNRYGDKRPTPGDLEDETVHGVGILHNLCAVNQEIRQIDVMARLTYPKYASPEAQAKAHDLDPSFPTEVNASTMALDIVTTDKGEVPCHLHSSFIGAKQTRRVTAVLSQTDDPSQPVYSIEFNFDVKVDGKIFDQLAITTLDGNTVKYSAFTADKLMDQTRAFITAAAGGLVDPRLTNYNKAREAVAFTEAVLASHKLGGQKVTAYTAGDIVPMKKTA